MTKTKTQMEQEIVAYLKKTSQHLFIDQSGKLFKVIPFQLNDKWYYATLRFNLTEQSVSIREALSDREFGWYGNSSLQVVKTNLFPVYDKKKSIPNFKAAKAITKAITEELLNGSNEETIKTKLSNLVKNLELQKAA